MRLPTYLIAFFTVIASSFADEPPFDMHEVRDPATLESRVIHDWQPNAKDPTIHQKLIEITVCEWWPGQKVRLPVTLNIPAGATGIKNVIVANSSLALKTATPTGVELDLLKNHQVGVVLIGMSTIDAMPPVGELHIGMREHLLSSKDIRYTPAWIWGMSQMRSLTAAQAEVAIFQPEKVITTGGSKRGVAAAAAGIHDDRFTGIVPVVAPITGNPGGSYVFGMDDPEIMSANEQFLSDISAGKLPLEPSVRQALEERDERRSDQRITLEQAQDAGWTPAEIDAITERAWRLCRIADHLEAVKKRGLKHFYIVGTNDSVSPALLELGKVHADFPHCIIPGGQHGGPATAGFTHRTPLLDEARDDFRTFCLAHFFAARSLPETPRISVQRDTEHSILQVTASFPDGTEPQENALSWSIDRHRPYTLAFEYDEWQTVDMKKVGPATYRADIALPDRFDSIEFLSNHTDTSNDLPFHISSALHSLSATQPSTN